MPKLGMAPIRRKQLVAAAIAVIHEDGFARATVARIARRAGVSSGIVHHYFADKDDLLLSTMRSLLADLRADAVAAVLAHHRVVVASSKTESSVSGWRSMAMPAAPNGCSASSYSTTAACIPICFIICAA